ncbi:hypothetical protein [Streptomyces sp. NPDC012508]
MSQWTRDGRRWTSAVSYGPMSAEHRQTQLGADGATDTVIEIVNVTASA